MQTGHSITWSIARAGGVQLLVAKCACGGFIASGKRLSTADRRRSERLAEEHLDQVSGGSGVRQEDTARSHGESLQQGPDTSSTMGTAGESPHGEVADAASVANQVAAPDRASHAAPGPSDHIEGASA